tara:strand:+ start:172 stop:555 length:384 start_codon:yes stop_codon:yes gene_type:complete
MPRKAAKFWASILDADNTTSSKRLITLLISLHFIMASFVILFLVCYVIMYLPKGRVEKDLLDALGKVLEYDFYIILSGLGFITSEGVVKMFVTKNTPPPPPNPYGGYGTYTPTPEEPINPTNTDNIP